MKTGKSRGRDQGRLAAIEVLLSGGLRKAEIARVLGVSRQCIGQAVEWYKARARDIAAQAIEKGKIVKPRFCDLCGLPGELEKHHPDYSQPLTVQWLHRSCHRRLHQIAEKAVAA